MLERLEAVLQPIMWRNDKISVGDELKLPPRTLDVSAANPSVKETLLSSNADAFTQEPMLCHAPQHLGHATGRQDC